jgi:uncharacterized protein YukE
MLKSPKTDISSTLIACLRGRAAADFGMAAPVIKRRTAEGRSGQMGGGDGFEVKFDALEKAAEAYKAQGEAVKADLGPKFQAAADLPASAFGRIPEAAQLAASYQGFLKQVMTDMEKLSESLITGASKLNASAANYRSADAASTTH